MLVSQNRDYLYFLCAVLIIPSPQAFCSQDSWFVEKKKALRANEFANCFVYSFANENNKFTQFVQKTYLYHQLPPHNCLRTIPLLWNSLWCNVANKLR